MSETDAPDAPLAAALVAERLHLCDFLDSLDGADWSAPSRCDGWTVRRRAEEFSPAELIKQLHDDARSTKKSFGSSPADGLTDAIVHGQDISRALEHLTGSGVDGLRLRLT